jgi:hypothetical protein
VLAAMAMYSDLLFAVSGDPIDVRASIYEIIAANILFLKIKKNSCHGYCIKRIKFSGLPNFRVYLEEKKISSPASICFMFVNILFYV